MNKKPIALVMGFFHMTGILVLLSTLAGCGTAMIVTDGKTKLDGVPFYTKAVACKQETVWLEPIYKLTLVGTKDVDKKPVEVFKLTKEISLPDYQSDGFKKLIDAVLQIKTQEIVKTFNTLGQYKPPVQGSMPGIDKLILASNQNESISFIDYTHPYYYNAKIPWVGSVNAEVNLSSDLTLSKATANITQQTLKTFLDLLPVKEVLTGMAKAAKETKPPDHVDIQLTIEPQVYKYTLSTTGAKNAELPCKDPAEPLGQRGWKGAISRTLMSADELKRKEDGGGSTIKFSGSVDLPKSQTQPAGSKP